MTTIEHTIEIECWPQALYEYLTQPWLWHEWHPNSRCASAGTQQLAPGDHFREVFEIQLVPFIPLKIQRVFDYTVVNAEPYSLWEIRGVGTGVELQFRYEFEPSARGVRFTRKLNYQLSGTLALLAPLARRRNARMSELAMAGLARKMAQNIESGGLRKEGHSKPDANSRSFTRAP